MGSFYESLVGSSQEMIGYKDETKILSLRT